MFPVSLYKNQILFWVKVALVVLTLSLFYYGGYKTADNIWSAKYSKLEKVHALEVAQMERSSKEQLERSVSSYQTLQAAIEHIDKQQYQELANAQKSISQLRADMLSGNKRLSVLVQSSNLPTTDKPNDSGLGDGEETAYLDGRVAEGLVRLGGYANESIYQLGACQSILDAIVKNDQQALSKALQQAQK